MAPLLTRLAVVLTMTAALFSTAVEVSPGSVTWAAGPRNELSPEELLARAEQFRDRVGPELGDAMVSRVAACMQQANEEGTLNDTWIEQCAQDIAAALRAAPPPAASAGPPPEPETVVAVPQQPAVMPPTVTTNPPVAEPPTPTDTAGPVQGVMPGDEEVMDDCVRDHGLGAVEACAAAIHENSPAADCVFFQTVVLGADMNTALLICGSLPTEAELTGSQPNAAQPGPAPVPTATQAPPPPAVSKPAAGANNQARCREIEQQIAKYFDEDFFKEGREAQSAAAEAMSQEYVRLGCQPPA